MNNALLYLGGLLIAALAALFAVPHFVDWNSYRGLFEEEASRILGREVRVGGAVNVRFLPVPYVRFEKVRIADADTAASGSIFRVDSFTMWLAVPPLLRGVLEAHQVELRRPVVQLATDASGGGNWRTLSLNPGSMPFVPNGVALQSVRVIDGAIIMSGPAQGELARFDAINGELAADALDGPFKFKGTLAWDGSPRQVRVVTAKYDASGDLRFKAAVESPHTGNSYVLDGRLSELGGKPKLDGDLTAKLKFKPKSVENAEPKAIGPSDASLPAMEAGAAKEVGAAPRPGKNEPASFELKAKVAGDASGAKLSELTVSLEQDGAPQIIMGNAKLDWSNKLRLDVNLSSKWLDLDRLAGGTENATKIPLEAARSYFGALAAILPQEADTNAELEFDQLTLGGEPIGNVRLAASRSGGPLELKGVRATLPGGARLLLDGVLQPGGAMPKLDGTLFITGQSLLRFLAWGFREQDIAAGRTDGPFALDGHFELSQADIALTDATAEWSGTALHGGIKLGLGERKKVALTLEGSRVDAAQIHSGLVGLASLKGLMSGLALESLAGPATTAPTTGTTPTAEPIASKITGANTDISLRLKIAELTDGRRVLRDFDAEIAIEKGALSFPALKFSTPDGLIVEAEGEATDIVSRPRGAIRALISAPTAPAARTLVRLLDLPENENSFADRVASLAPLRVAGILDFHGERGAASELSLDGSLAGGRLTARLNLDGGYQHWRTAPIDLGLTMNGIDAGRVLSALFDVPTGPVAGVPANTGTGATANTDADADEGSVSSPVNSGQLSLKAVGTPASGLVSLALLTGDGVSLEYHGRVTLPEGAAVSVLGDVRATARDSRGLLAFTGVPIAAGAADVPLSGTLSVALRDTTLRLESTDLTLGGSALKGVLSIGKGTNGKPDVTADLDVASASMASLLSPILARPTAPVEAAPERVARGGVASVPPTAPIWPDQPFDLALLERVGGTVKVKIGTFSIEPGLAISNATLEATLSERGIKVGSLTGKALGGRLVSQLDFEKAAAGAGLKGTLRVDIASKADAAAAAPGDIAAFSVDFSGRALSPAALISALDGKGEVSVGNAAISGMSPASVSAVVETGLAGKGPVAGEPLEEAIKTGLRQGELKLGKVAIPLKVHDGALLLEKVRIEQAEGRSTFETTVELATMKLDSEWQIEAKLARTTGPPERAYLPPVTIVYTGKLTEYGALEPTVSVAALERELGVRKMERDVEHLEQLRKADQARAAQDRERRRLLEAERNAAGNNNSGTAVPLPGAADPSTNAPVPPGRPQPPTAPAAQPQSGAAVAPGAGTTGATAATPQGAPPAAGANPADPASAAAQATAAAQTTPPATSAPEVAGTDEQQRSARRRKPPQTDGWQPFLTPF